MEEKAHVPCQHIRTSQNIQNQVTLWYNTKGIIPLCVTQRD